MSASFRDHLSTNPAKSERAGGARRSPWMLRKGGLLINNGTKDMLDRALTTGLVAALIAFSAQQLSAATQRFSQITDCAFAGQTTCPTVTITGEGDGR